jgi:hypothetical protein
MIDEDFAESPTIVAVRTVIEELLGGAYFNPTSTRTTSSSWSANRTVLT